MVSINQHLEQYPTLLTVGEVAFKLGCSTKTIYQWIKQGEMPGVIKIGKSIRINGDILLRFIKDQNRKVF
jgi:excisionase family DNA binding protein